jgi:hypothetical protein
MIRLVEEEERPRLLPCWLLRGLSSHRRLPFTSAFASHCTAASHCAPLTPLVWLVVTSLLVTTPPPDRLRLRLSSCPSQASCLAGCCIASHHTAVSCPPVPLPLITPPPLTVPLLCLLSGWLSHHFLSCCHFPSTCTSTYHCAPLAPLVRLIVASPLVTPPLPPVACASASHCAAASHRAPLAPLFRLVVASPLVMLPPVRLPSTSHHTTASHCAPLAPLVWLVVTLPLVMPPPPISLRLCLSGHCRVLAVLLLGCVCD